MYPLSLAFSTPVVGLLPHKVRLKAASPLAGFNQLFPDGIPTAQAEPNLCLSGQDHYEAILPDTLNTAGLAVALFQPEMPTALCKLWLDWGIVALPIDWVEVVR